MTDSVTAQWKSRVSDALVRNSKTVSELRCSCREIPSAIQAFSDSPTPLGLVSAADNWTVIGHGIRTFQSRASDLGQSAPSRPMVSVGAEQQSPPRKSVKRVKIHRQGALASPSDDLYYFSTRVTLGGNPCRSRNLGENSRVKSNGSVWLVSFKVVDILRTCILFPAVALYHYLF